MSWIKLREDLSVDPSVAVIASRCSVTACHAVGALACAWSWAGRLSEDGKVPLATPELLDRVTQTPGLARAMESAGWLEIGDAYLLFPKWDRHNSEGSKKRDLAAERQRRHRETPERDDPVTQRRDQRRGEEKREEERREEQKKTPPPPSGGSDSVGSPPPESAPASKQSKARKPKPRWVGTIPPELNFEAFVAEWGLWLRYRDEEKGAPVTQLSGDALLGELVPLGPIEGARRLRHARASGWQGCEASWFERKGSKRNGSSGAPTETPLEQRKREGLERMVAMSNGGGQP